MLDYQALAALRAVLDTGSFDHAAARLNVTPSAISQRIKALEERMGAALVIRANPCTGTAMGLRLAHHAAQVALMEAQLIPADAPPELRIAVNADSLATWFLPVLPQLPDHLFDLVIDDEGASDAWLRRGEVLGAITSQARAVAGCDILPLGALRYIATASPAFAARHFGTGITAETLSRAPALVFDRRDGMQARWARRRTGLDAPLRAHHLASSQGFVDATLMGIGWALNPECMVHDHLARGRLVALDDQPMDTALYWQSLRQLAGPLKPLAQAIRQAAAAVLVPPDATRD